MPRARTASPWRFRLWHVFVGVALANVLFAFIAWGGLFGAVLFGLNVGGVLIIIGALTRNRRYLLVGGPLAIVAGGLLLAGSTVACGVGHTKRLCTIEVLDENSGDPISGAAVRIRDVRSYGPPDGLPIQPAPIDEHGVDGVTDATGTTTIAFEFTFSERTGLFVNDAHLYISDNFWIQVEAPGHEREVVQLNSFTGPSYNYYRQPLPKMTARLKRR